MHHFRKLLIAGTNELLKNHSIDLDHTKNEREENGYIKTTIFDRHSIVLWQHIKCNEIQVSIWWDYNHQAHPQADAEGDCREQFRSMQPLCRPKYFPRVIAASCTGYLEREEGKYLQGKDKQGILEPYLRKGEKDI
jgi:hypothetical protein